MHRDAAKYYESRDLPVFVVDDSKEALILLSRILTKHKYKVHAFSNGNDILEEAIRIKPYLIILDIMMPGINGFEVCRRLKAESQTKPIPIMFISALGDTNIITEGFNLGGVDYITKPINTQEVIARVNTNVQLYILQKELLFKNLALEEEIRAGEKNKKALEESLQLFQGLFNASPDAIVLIDPHDPKVPWSIVDCNDAACKMNGYTRKELVGQPIDILNIRFSTQKEHDEYLQNLKKNKSVALETNHKHKDGHLFPIEVRTNIVNIGDKEYVLGIDRDITQRKKVEEELINAKVKAEESDRLKSAFLANMSHEIRTPLNSILGFSELLSMPDLSEQEREEYSQLIELSGNNLLGIINDIIDISKIESGQIEVNNYPFRISQLIEGLEAEFTHRAKQKGLKFLVRNSDANAVIESDQSKLNQVLTNFISNSIKFTEEGSIELGIEINGINVQFYVKDTGIGIQDDFKDYVFERFRQIENPYTRKYGGNGLGLAISKHLIELLGGEIGFESNYKEGSTFFFTLPIDKLKIESE